MLRNIRCESDIGLNPAKELSERVNLFRTDAVVTYDTPMKFCHSSDLRGNTFSFQAQTSLLRLD